MTQSLNLFFEKPIFYFYSLFKKNVESRISIMRISETCIDRMHALLDHQGPVSSLSVARGYQPHRFDWFPFGKLYPSRPYAMQMPSERTPHQHKVGYDDRL